MNNPPTDPKKFHDLTSLMPELIADRVLDICRMFCEDYSIDKRQKAWFADHVSLRVRQLHANDSMQRRMLESDGNEGRDIVYVWAAHWAGKFMSDPEKYMVENPHQSLKEPRGAGGE